MTAPSAATAVIRILVVDDHPLMRDGVTVLLRQQADMEVVGEAGDGEAAVRAYAELRPDVVLMDLKLPCISGHEALCVIRARDPAARVVMLTTYDGDAQVGRALKAGAAGYLLKSTLHRELLSAVRAVHGGHRWIDRGVAEDMALHVDDPVLTERQLKVLQLVADGCANKVIARRLGISEDTVKTHLKHVFGKLDVTDRTQAAVVAPAARPDLRLSILSGPEEASARSRRTPAQADAVVDGSVAGELTPADLDRGC